MLKNIKIIKPAIHIYYFAPKDFSQDGVFSQNTLNFFKDVWCTCDQIGIKDDNHYLNLSAKFPSISSTDTSFRPLAAKFNRELKSTKNYDQQTFVFEHGDYFGLIITVENSSGVLDFGEWEKLEREFCAFFPIPPSENIAIDCFYLYTGLLPINDESITEPENVSNSVDEYLSEENTAQNIFRALPPVTDNARKSVRDFLPDTLSQQWKLWHKSFKDRGVSLLILAPDFTDTINNELFEWSTWTSTTQIAPLVGYLLHSSKLNFASRVFWNERQQIKEEKASANETLQSLIHLNENVIKYDIDISIDELAKVESELLYAQTKSYGLLYSLSRLYELRSTVKTAQTNMESFISLKSILSNQNQNSFFAGNYNRAYKLIEQIDIDIGYLENSQERINEGYNLTRLLQDRESKKIARRLNSLVLWQGSLIGALGIGLTALQAFQIKPPIDESIFLPLSLFLGALALSLPALFIHWEDGYNKKDHFIGGILVSALILLSVTVLNKYLVLFTVPDWFWSTHYYIALFTGFLTGWFMIFKLSWVRRIFIRSKFNIPLDDDRLKIWIKDFLEQANKSTLSSKFQTELKCLLDLYSENKTILTKHELLNLAHKLYLIKENLTMNLRNLALDGAKIVLTKCLSLDKGDILAIFWDEDTEETANVFIGAAKDLRINVRQRKISLEKQSQFVKGQDLSFEDSEILSGSRGIITCLSNHARGTSYRLKLLEEGTSKGIRFGHMPGANLELLAHAAVNINYEEASKRCDDLALALTVGKKATLQTYIFSPDGSQQAFNLNFDLGGVARPAITSTGIISPGTWGNIPGGETFIAPMEDTAEGTYVLNGAFTNYIFDESAYLLLHFSEGNLVKIEGNVDAKKKLEAIFDSRHPEDEFYNSLAELGIGVNTEIAKLTGNALFDEKCAGTAHIAVGDNMRYGGTHHSSIHEDMISRNPSLWIDEKPILDHGENVFDPKDWRETLEENSNSVVLTQDVLISRKPTSVGRSPIGEIQIYRKVTAGRECIYTVGESKTSQLLAKIYFAIPAFPQEVKMSDLEKSVIPILKTSEKMNAAISILVRHKLISIGDSDEEHL